MVLINRYYDLILNEIMNTDYNDMYNNILVNKTYTPTLINDNIIKLLHLLEHKKIKDEHVLNRLHMMNQHLCDEDSLKHISLYQILFIVCFLDDVKNKIINSKASYSPLNNMYM